MHSEFAVSYISHKRTAKAVQKFTFSIVELDSIIKQGEQ